MDRIVVIIKADPNKERIDSVITRWIKRHLQWLGAEINLDQLNSLVENRDMLAENLENLVKKEQLEGERRGLEKGRQEGRQEGFSGLLRMQLMFKFGDLPPWVETKLATATDEQLSTWGMQMLTANSFDELFKH